MRMLEYNEMMSILLLSQQPVTPEPGEGGSTLSYQPSAELLQKAFQPNRERERLQFSANWATTWLLRELLQKTFVRQSRRRWSI